MIVGIIICIITLITMILILVWSMRQSRKQREQRRGALIIDRSALQQATQALDTMHGGLDFMAMVLGMNKKVSYANIVRKMDEVWGATPTQTCFVLISAGVHPLHLDHRNIIPPDALSQLVIDINRGDLPALPTRRRGEEETESWKGVLPPDFGNEKTLPAHGGVPSTSAAVPGRAGRQSATTWGHPAVATQEEDAAPDVFQFSQGDWMEK